MTQPTPFVPASRGGDPDFPGIPELVPYMRHGGRIAANETFEVFRREGVNMAHRSADSCINRAIAAGVRICGAVTLADGRVGVIRKATDLD